MVKSAYSFALKKEKIEQHIIVVWVDNESGVLARVVGLFSGRGDNIYELAVAEVEKKKNISSYHINLGNDVARILTLADLAWRPNDNEMKNAIFNDYDWKKWKKN